MKLKLSMRIRKKLTIRRNMYYKKRGICTKKKTMTSTNKNLRIIKKSFILYLGRKLLIYVVMVMKSVPC